MSLEERLTVEFRNIWGKLEEIHNDVSACKSFITDLDKKVNDLNDRLNFLQKHFVSSAPNTRPKKGPQVPPTGQPYMIYYSPQ